MNKKDALRVMNKYGKNKIPFLFITDFDISHNTVIPLDKINPDRILYSLNGKTNVRGDEEFPITAEISFSSNPVDYECYLKGFNTVRENLLLGNTYLANLTFATEVKTNLTFDEIFFRASAPYRLLFKDRFVVFSPETFIKIDSGRIRTYPMKGTIRAGIPNAEEIIINDMKEKAEHITIVDLLRNDLNTVSENVRVDKFRYIDRVETLSGEILQVSSEISGDLPLHYNENIGDILFSILPAGSITGAPKKMTVDIIKRAEQYKRGFYTGVFGIFDGINLDSAVMIRFMEKNDNRIYYKSGGGITIYSDPHMEYREMADKIYVPFK